MLVYKMNVLEELKKKGWTGYTLQTKKDEHGKVFIGAANVQKIRNGFVVGNITLERICELLERQPGDIIEWIPDERYKALKKSGYFEQMGIPTPPLDE